jgi:hypothetical protein
VVGRQAIGNRASENSNDVRSLYDADRLRDCNG